jgi:hypothetical protein
MKGSPQDHYGLPITNSIHVMLFSLCKEQAQYLSKETAAVMDKSPDLRDLERGSTTMYSTFRIGGGEVRVMAKSALVTSVRGVACKTALLDEMAYYHEAHEIYWAVLPSVSRFSDGRIVAWSTPKWNSDFHRIFANAIGDASGRCLAMQIPTWEMAPFVPTDIFQDTKKRDPLVFAVEFGAEFLDTTPIKTVCPHCGK